jgi:hypothetical protein
LDNSYLQRFVLEETIVVLAYTTQHKLQGLKVPVAMAMPARPFMRWASNYTFLVDDVPTLSLPEEFWKTLKN